MSGDEKSVLGTTRSTSSDDDSPGVPGFRTWTAVYWFVLVWFIGCVLGLTLLTRLT
jgi:hypothetical protein